MESNPLPSSTIGPFDCVTLFVLRPFIAVAFVLSFILIGWILAWKLVLVHVPLVQEIFGLRKKPVKPKPLHRHRYSKYYSSISRDRVDDVRVVVCLLLRKTVPLMNFIQSHPVIIKQLVDLIRITSIMEVLIRLIGADAHMYTNHTDGMHWIEDTDILEMIVDMFSSSDSPEVHANAAETLCAITRFSPPGLFAKISSPSFIGQLFRHALEDSRPESVLVNSLSFCLSLLDPKRLTTGPYQSYNRQLNHGSAVAAHPEIVEGMLGSLGDLLKLLDVSSSEKTLATTYGKLQPPLGKHRLKIVEFIAVLVNVGSQAVEKELIHLEVVPRILGLFFEYPYNNFLHHHIESIIMTCLERKNAALIEYILGDCDLIGKILDMEKNSNLSANPEKPTLSTEARSLPRVGNIGHLMRICNKLVPLANSSSAIQKFLQENEWTDWQTNVLSKRNAVENVYQWACGRPTALQGRTRDNDDDDYQDRNYDVAALANNLSQAFRYGNYYQEEIDEPHSSLGRVDEDVYFDDESAEVVISSLRLGDDQESGSLFTNSNWFAFDDDRVSMEKSAAALASSASGYEGHAATAGDDGEVISGESSIIHSDCPMLSAEAEDSVIQDLSTEVVQSLDLVDWEEASNTNDEVGLEKPPAANGWLELENRKDEAGAETAEAECPPVDTEKAEAEHPSLDPASLAVDANLSTVNGESAKEAEVTHETGKDENPSVEAEKSKLKEHNETRN